MPLLHKEESKKAYFSVDLELLSDIESFSKIIKEEPDYSNEIETLLIFLDNFNIKATFFACYNFIIKNERLINRIILKGHDLALHYVNHRNDNITVNEFIKEIELAKKDIKNRFGVDIIGYRAPSFNLNNDQYQALIKLGFKYDSSYFLYKRANFYSNFEVINSLKEFPVWSSKSFPLAGGAYLRLLPFFLMKSKFKRYLKRNNYYNFYIHPYDFSTQVIYKKNTPIKMKLFFSKNTQNYLNRIKWLVEYLFKKGFKFNLYKEDLT